MKKRLGFVTNSSSTSFLISNNPEKSLKVKLSIEVDLSNYVTSRFEGEQGFLDLTKYDEYSENTKKLFMDEIAKGNVISRLSFSNEDGDGISSFMHAEIGEDCDDEVIEKILEGTGIKNIHPTYK